MTLHAVGAIALLAELALAAPWRMSAHCDTMDGPVIVAAQAALHAGDVTPVLKWIPKASEPEIRAVFGRTLKVRAISADAKELADAYFFETLVRIHRAGEGEPYTGLKPAGTQIEPDVAAADKALDNGSADQLVHMVANEIGAGIRERFNRALQDRKTADESVESGRKYVAAYVDLMHYLEQLDQARMDTSHRSVKQ